ncbi:hypothetical protein FI667_g1203, partial [Globisporangium splendens]
MSALVVHGAGVGVGSTYTEAQLVVLVLAVFVIAVALLSYFVVAPECEKRLHEQFAAACAFHEESKHQNERVLATMKKTTLQKHKSLGSWDMEAASSDDDAFDHHLQRLHAASNMLNGSDDDSSLRSTTSRPPMSLNSEYHKSMVMRLTDAQRKLLARRRKSESDALKHANIHRAEMLRRRVMLKKLEEEIKGAIKETSDAQQQQSSSAPSSLRGDSRRLSNDALNLTEDRVKMLQEHPADCAHELRVLATQTPIVCADKSRMMASDATTTPSSLDAADSRTNEVKAALQTVHDVLSFYLSVDHRDMTKLTVFCNSLLQHDGLNHLRAFEVSCDQDIRTLSTSIIEKAVPAIWH